MNRVHRPFNEPRLPSSKNKAKMRNDRKKRKWYNFTVNTRLSAAAKRCHRWTQKTSKVLPAGAQKLTTLPPIPFGSLWEGGSFPLLILLSTHPRSESFVGAHNWGPLTYRWTKGLLRVLLRHWQGSRIVDIKRSLRAFSQLSTARWELWDVFTCISWTDDCFPVGWLLLLRGNGGASTDARNVTAASHAHTDRLVCRRLLYKRRFASLYCI